MIPLPNYQELSQALVNSYEYNLIKQFNLTTDDRRDFFHPFYEDTTESDLLRRIKTSKITNWSQFIYPCITVSQEDLAKAPKSLTDLDPNSQDLPVATLVCDLHYEKEWAFRRRYVQSCADVDINTKPCDGTFACLCMYGDTEFYRVSKTMPVVPDDYRGLNTTLSQAFFITKTDGEQSQDEELSIIMIAVIIGSATIGTIFLCCICYYCGMYFANRSHRVSYLDKKKSKVATMRKST